MGNTHLVLVFVKKINNGPLVQIYVGVYFWVATKVPPMLQGSREGY